MGNKNYQMKHNNENQECEIGMEKECGTIDVQENEKQSWETTIVDTRMGNNNGTHWWETRERDDNGTRY